MGPLHELSDEELAHYGRIAEDQLRRETRFATGQALVSLVAALVLMWAIVSAFETGLDRVRLVSIGLAGLIAWWPYRKARSRRIWRRHVEAVLAEKALRATRRCSEGLPPAGGSYAKGSGRT